MTQLLIWILILLAILLILAFPVGVDAAYDGDDRFLKLKLGPFRKTLLPAEKKEKRKREKKKDTQQEPPDDAKEKIKKRLTLDDILTLAEIGIDTVRRFRMHLSVDRLVMYWTAGAPDPCDAVMQYGRVNAVIGAVLAKAHTRFKIREEDVRTEIDLTAARPEIRFRAVLSIQIWEILLIAVSAAVPGLRWMIKRKRSERAASADAAVERSIQDGEFEYR